jgi:molybdate transport system substrate-binding protein
MNTRWIALLATFAVMTLTLASCSKAPTAPPQAKPPLLVYVGGTMEPAVKVLAERWQKKTGQQVQLDAADSGVCLVKIEKSGQGDLYISHAPFPAAARKKGYADQSYVVATLSPVIVVPKSNPKGIKGLKDLAAPGLRLGLTDAKYSTLGYLAPKMFDKAGVRAAIEKNVVVRQRSGGGVANEVILGHLDAAIVWDAVAFLRKEKIDTIPIEANFRLQPKVDTITSATYDTIDMGKIDVEAQTLKKSANPEQAKAFAEFLASDEAAEVFGAFGFSPK